MPISFSKKLLTWYEKYGRHDLPWQHNPTSYRVWISEIMLQQTQVTTVIPYYKRFMQSFPTVKALALASEDAVLSHWSGLGYYARARNIHKTAKIIHTQYKGRFPDSVDALSELPGIGRSTAGAILSFSMQKKATILDGNVKRVLSRYFAIQEPMNTAQTIKALWERADALTPEKTAHLYNQAIMDLGATLCTRTKPRCSDCPFTTECLAHQSNAETMYPVKIAKKTRPVKNTRMLIIRNSNGEVLLLKRPTKGIWGGLWSFPEIDMHGDYHVLKHDDCTLQLKYIDELEKITHQFTHFTLTIFPMLLETKQDARTLDSSRAIWYKLNTPEPGGIAAPVTKILKVLL
jgi:A/G-specific adenine glycosylase